LEVFEGAGLDGDFGFGDCLRAFGGTGGGGIIFADDCDSDGGDLDLVSTLFGKGSSFIETSPSMTEESTSIISSTLATSLPLPLGTVFCLDRLGAGSTGMGSKGLAISFPTAPETLREVLPEVLAARSPGATS